jgi:PPM family protein phosphatase
MSAVDYAGLSDIGRQRSSNQDRWAVDAEQRLFMVADGVASSSDGGLAAQMVVELLPSYLARYLKPLELDDAAAPAQLGRAVAELSDDLRAKGKTDARIAGATTTVVAAVVAGSRALVAHLGDSRAYLYRARQLHHLTRDHSLLEALIDAGEVAAEDADGHSARSVLTRHVAMRSPALPDVAAIDLRPSDRILLCSDGLYGVVDDASLAEILDLRREPGNACAALIDAANSAGGPDNITALVVDIADTG